MPLLPVLARMEEAGIRVDVERLSRARRRARRDVRRRSRRRSSASRASRQPPQQRADRRAALREAEAPRLAGRKRASRTEKGTGFATDERTLLELADVHPIPRTTARLAHGSRSSRAPTSTRCPASSTRGPAGSTPRSTRPAPRPGGSRRRDPNLQNIPIRGDEGRAIRGRSCAEAGWRLLSADYSQIELRLLAHLSRRPGLVRRVRAGEDVHRATAAKVFGVAPADVTPRVARAREGDQLRHRLRHGRAEPRAADRRLASPRRSAFIEAYFRIYPSVRAYEEGVVARGARRRATSRRCSGRGAPLPEIDSDDGRMRSAAERVAVNTPLQGTAADIIKLAMIAIDRRLAAERLAARCSSRSTTSSCSRCRTARRNA